MIKKEISEIRKLFTHENSSISKIVGCYVNNEKEKVTTIDDTFQCLPEEESFKYFEILAKSLSGTLGKNLLNMDFPLDSELGDGPQKFLLSLRDSELKDEELLNQFYDMVIENYECVGNYFIMLVHANYDVPGMTSDGLEMEDASNEVYEFVLCCICPVDLEKAALSYDIENSRFGAKERKLILGLPMNGFLYPAFNDRASDVHAALYYTKNAEKINQSFIDGVLGFKNTLTAGTQKESFQTILAESLGEECEYEVIRTIHEKVNEIIEETKDDPEPLILDKVECLKVLEACGVAQEKVKVFEEKYDDEIGADSTLQATNIVDTRSMKVKTASVEIKVSPENADLLETRIIDGRRCIVIALDDSVQVNGIPVKPGAITEPADASEE